MNERKNLIILSSVGILLYAASCKEPFMPPMVKNNPAYLEWTDYSSPISIQPV
jgi:hypothetical protein